MRLSRQDIINQRKQEDKNTLRKKGEQCLYNKLRKDFNNKDIFGMKINEYVEMLKREIVEENK